MILSKFHSIIKFSRFSIPSTIRCLSIDVSASDKTSQRHIPKSKGVLKTKPLVPTDWNDATIDVEISDNDKNHEAARNVTKLGALGNIGLASSKGLVGIAVGSTALVADAVNSLSDLLCDAVVYYAITEARKRATPERPWGRGKIEPLGALVVGTLVCATGAGIGYSALNAAVEMATLSMGLAESGIDSSIHNIMESKSFMTTAALGVSCVSVVAKEGLFRYTLKAGKKANSAAVIANAWQHRADAFISAAVFAGLLGSTMGYPLLDPLAGILVSGIIAKQGLQIGLEALKDLGDVPANAQETQKLRDTCMNVPGILCVKEMLARKSGPHLFVECTVGVPGMLSASAAHRLAQLARTALMEQHKGRVANAVVHVNPIGSAGMGENAPSWARCHDKIEEEVTRAVLTLQPEITAVSEVQVYYKDDGGIMVKVDVSMQPELSIRTAHGMAVKARRVIQAVLPNIASVDVDLELDEAVANETTQIKPDTLLSHDIDEKSQ